MTDPPILSDEGVRRRHSILQVAIEEGQRLRKRRRANRVASVSGVLGLVLVTALMLREANRNEGDNGIVANNQDQVSSDFRRADSPFNSMRVEIISSNATSIDECIIRTAEIRLPVTVLGDDELIESLRDARFGVARVGEHYWLTRDDGTLMELN